MDVLFGQSPHEELLLVLRLRAERCEQSLQDESCEQSLQVEL